jgi:hypothetical protein
VKTSDYPSEQAYTSRRRRGETNEAKLLVL